MMGSTYLSSSKSISMKSPTSRIASIRGKRTFCIVSSNEAVITILLSPVRNSPKTWGGQKKKQCKNENKFFF